MKRIFLAGYYDIVDKKTNKLVSLASKQKTDYLINALLELGYQLTVFSCALSKGKFTKEEHVVINDNLDYYFCPSFYSNRITKKINHLYSLNWLKKKIIKNCKDSIVISYHSIYLISPLIKAKKSINFKLISEVEEIYSNTIFFKRCKKKEMNFFKYCDSFITITDKLNAIINSNNKSHAIFYGPYKMFCKKNVNKFNNGFINLVYAGTADLEKGGLSNSLKLIKCLDDKYRLHLLISDDIELAKQQVNSELNDKSFKVLYIGQLEGDALKDYLSKCAVGLALQKVGGSFDESSFPSKTLLYYSCGMKVLSTKSISLQNTPFENEFILCDDNWGEVAKKIDNLVCDKINNNVSILDALDKSFKNELRNILNE